MQFYQTDIIPILQNLRKCIYQDTDIITSNNNIGKTKLPPTYYIKNYNQDTYSKHQYHFLDKNRLYLYLNLLG